MSLVDPLLSMKNLKSQSGLERLLTLIDQLAMGVVDAKMGNVRCRDSL
jgi:hypothetical protein